MSLSLRLLAACGMFSGSTGFAANIIDSIYGIGAGSFELPGHAHAQYVTLSSGSTAMTGWTVDPTTIDWVKVSVWNASQGDYSLDLNGSPSGIGGVSTIIPTTEGTTYRITFDIAAYTAPGSGTNPKTMEVSASGTTTSFSLTTTHHYTTPFALPLTVTWEERTMEFVATGPSTTISFKSTVPADQSAMLLDNVAVVAVPEPSAALVAALGLLAPLVIRRRQS